MEVGVQVWLKDNDEAWITATIQSKEHRDGKIYFVVRSSKNETQTFSVSDENEDLDNIKLQNDPSEILVDNLINLPYLHEPAILHCLEERYESSDIYTYTGPILIAVNPFKSVPLYSTQILENYYNYGLIKSQSLYNSAPLAPHVFAIADNAYRDMMSVILQGFASTKKLAACNQAILISGESGAGKTESTKIVLKYLTTLGSNVDGSQSEGSVMDKVLQSNPILEAFGNARTIRNDNSSRFGKFIELNFNKRGHLVGGLIRTYLLEKVRLPSQQSGERNFHIFYQIFAASPEEKKAWKLRTPDLYWYTSQGNMYTLRHVDDVKEFQALKQALVTLNFAETDRVSLLNVMAGLLHLGQLKFLSDKDGDGSVLDSDEYVKESLITASQLLGISSEALTRVFTIRVITARDESYEKKLLPEQACDARDAFSKAVYGQFFEWIVRTINQSIQVDPNQIRAEIGVLDIFGFECFKHNSFEQLCINYTNETLQQQFNQFVFKQEQIEYERENIQWSFISFPDNQEILDLIENKQRGILSMLDDECRLPGASDEKFASRLYKEFEGNHNRFTTSNIFKRDSKFCIIHYAGQVIYSTATFVEKNKDELPKEAYNILQASSVSLVTKVFIYKIKAFESIQNKSKGSANVSVGSQFKEQLAVLMEKIYSTAPHYIRCLKPNDENVPDSLDRKRTAEQLRYGGVLEAVRVARSGFPVRLSHLDFYSRYRSLANPFNPKTSKMPIHLIGTANKTGDMSKIKPHCDTLLEMLCDDSAPDIADDSVTTQISDHRDKIKATFHNTMQNTLKHRIIQVKFWRGKVELQKESIQLGLTKVFFRKSAHDILESRRSRRLFTAARQIQSVVRGKLKRSFYVRYIWAIRTIQRLTRGMLARKTTHHLRREKAAIKLQTSYRSYIAYSKYQNLLYAIIMLQSRYRGMEAKATYFKLREIKNTIRLQRFIRGIIKKHQYHQFRHAVIALQCGCRKKQAKKELVVLKLAAKDLGVLKQSNENLKAEIEMLRSKAAEDSRRVEEKATALKVAEIARLMEELNELKKLYEAEVKTRKLAETKLAASEDSLAEMGTKLIKAVEAASSFEQQLLSSSSSSLSPRKLLAVNGTVSSPQKQQLSSNSPVSRRGSSSTHRKSFIQPNLEYEKLLEEYTKEKSEKELLEEEVGRLRHISLDLRSQVETLKLKNPSSSSSSSSSNTSQRRTQVESAKKNNNNAMNSSNNSKSVSLSSSVEETSLALDKSTHTSTAVSSSLALFQQNLEELKRSLRQGIRCIASEGDKATGVEAMIKLDPNNEIITFESIVKRFALFSRYEIQPIRIYDIYESIPGADTVSNRVDKTRMMTILCKASDSLDSRIIVVECIHIDDRNTLLTALRSLVSEMHLNSPAMKSIFAVNNTSVQKRMSISMQQVQQASSSSQSDGTDLDQLATPSDFKRQLLIERVNHEQMMVQVLMVTNDLKLRDEQISMLTKHDVVIRDNLAKLEKSHEQDAMVRLQLGRRLEQVLIEKEEALEELEMMKIQMEEIRSSFSKVVGDIIK